MPSRFPLISRYRPAEVSVRRVAAKTLRPKKRRPKFPRTRRRVDRIPATSMRRPPDTKRRLTIRLSDAGLHQRQTKTLYPNHHPPPWLTEGAPRDRSNRLLGDEL